MQIKLTFEECYDIIIKTLERSTGMKVNGNPKFVVEEYKDSEVIEKPLKEQFHALYIDLK